MISTSSWVEQFWHLASSLFKDIYGTDDILEGNKTLEIQGFACGFISIDDDSDGRVFLMLLSDKEEILIADSGDMAPNHAQSHQI